MEQGKWKIILGTALVAAVIFAIGFWFWQRLQKTSESESTGLGQEIFEKVENPLKDELPEANPFKAEANPFQKAETNPFTNTYKNPFE